MSVLAHCQSCYRDWACRPRTAAPHQTCFNLKTSEPYESQEFLEFQVPQIPEGLCGVIEYSWAIEVVPASFLLGLCMANVCAIHECKNPRGAKGLTLNQPEIAWFMNPSNSIELNMSLLSLVELRKSLVGIPSSPPSNH